MNWTKNKPTVPGWYWTSWKESEPEAVELLYDGDWELAVYYRGFMPLLTDEQFDDCIWYGPIMPPELPKE